MENINQEIEINESTFKKGIELEKEFSEYLKSEIGYDKIKTRYQVKQANNSRGANIDIIGQKLNSTGIAFKQMGTVWLIIFVIAIIFSFVIAFTDSFDNAWFKGLFFCGIALEIFSFSALIISNIYNIDNIWVECKNLKTKVNITQIHKMINEIKAYKASGDKQYKFKEFVFVSASGFIDNAIELATKNGIKCYIKEKNKFTQITNWN